MRGKRYIRGRGRDQGGGGGGDGKVAVTWENNNETGLFLSVPVNLLGDAVDSDALFAHGRTMMQGEKTKQKAKG